MKAIKKLSRILLAGGLILVSALSVSAAEQKKEVMEVAFFDEMGKQVKVTKEMEDSFRKQVAVDKENAEVNEEPLAELEVIKDKRIIDEIVSENPRIQKYLEQNEVFAEFEIITNQNEIEEIWVENPEVKELMQSYENYRLAYVNDEHVHLRNTASTSGEINGLLEQNKKDWVLLTDNYSLNENYIWWEIAASSIGASGWIVNDYIYLNADKSGGRAVTVPEIDFNTLKFIQ